MHGFVGLQLAVHRIGIATDCFIEWIVVNRHPYTCAIRASEIMCSSKAIYIRSLLNSRQRMSAKGENFSDWANVCIAYEEFHAFFS